MHQAGLIVWGALEKMRAMVKPGIQTKDLDEFAEEYTAEQHARPAFKGYRGYPGLGVHVDQPGSRARDSVGLA